jgi:hypothetical protein
LVRKSASEDHRDELVSLPKSALMDFVGRLDRSDLELLDLALGSALDLGPSA